MTRLTTLLIAALTLLTPQAHTQDKPRNPYFPSAAQESLFEAAQAGSLQGIRAAIEAGADVNWREDSGASALSYAAANATDPAVIEYLVDKLGADLLARHHYWTPLHCAAVSKRNNAAVIKALVERTSDQSHSDRAAGIAPSFMLTLRTSSRWLRPDGAVTGTLARS